MIKSIIFFSLGLCVAAFIYNIIYPIILEKMEEKRMSKEVKKHVNDIIQLLLNIDIPEKASLDDLKRFYDLVETWERVLNEKVIEFDKVMSVVSIKDKENLLNNINRCIHNYGCNMIEFNDSLLSCLNAENISQNTKAKICAFGKENVEKSDKTINTLRELAKHITFNK